MSVLETGDITDVKQFCATDSIDGPVYCRVLCKEVPRLIGTPLVLGEVRELALGTDIMLVTTGIATEKGMRARAALERAGVGVRHLHLHTSKPFDPVRLLDHAAAVGQGVITMEDHLVTNGVGSLVAQTLAKAGLARLGLQDTFAHGGSLPYQMPSLTR